ncbi:MAG: PDZ domain-containing protein [Aggregatilineales bacterium]
MKTRRYLLWMTGVALLVAMPIASIMVAAQDDTATESTATAFLGIGYEEADTGVRVTDVVADSPAEEAGLLIDDIITAINDVTVNFEDVADVIAGFGVGDLITLNVERGDETLALEATLVERPEEIDARLGRNQRFDIPMMNRPYVGIAVEDSDGGVVITQIIADSPAETAGLQVDDIITGINETDITESATLIEAIQQLESGDVVTFNVTRAGETLSVEVTLDTMQNVRPMILEGALSGIGIEYLADEGVLVINELGEDNPLTEAGLMAGDRISAVNGVALTPDELPNLMGMMNETLTLTVERDGETMEIEVEPANLLPLFMGLGSGRGILRGDFGDNFGRNRIPNMPNMPMIGDRARLGVTFVTLDETTATQYEVEATEGALVTEVAENSAADQAGLQNGDIITAVSGDVVDVERTLADRIAAYEPGDVITLTVTRDGETLEIDVTLGRFEQSTSFGQDGNFFNFRDNRGFGDGFHFNFPFGQGGTEPQEFQSQPNGDL